MLLTEFKQSLKNPWAEELVDLAVYRPLAFLLVKAVLPFPITPNQISCMAMVAGIGAGFVFSGGDPVHFLIGGVVYGLSNILDCCDGMIARIKKNGTLTGRIVDGIVDYVSSAAVYGGFAIGLTKAVLAKSVVLPCNPWILVLLAVASHAAHAVFSDKYRNGYLNLKKPEPVDAGTEREQFVRELDRLKQIKAHAFDRTLIKTYVWYLNLQTGLIGAKRPDKKLHFPEHFSALKAVLWNVIGPSTHISFLILAACLFNPMIYFAFVIGFANLWMILLFLMQLPGKK
ncbi:MAG: CDP-alcohol phosphatidyltransferase family protein [Chitinivibrionales bacterium]